MSRMSVNHPNTHVRRRLGQDRIFSIDSLRGFAMVLVILQHSYLSVNQTLIAPVLNTLIWDATGLAAVAFVSISGTVYSYFLFVDSDWGKVYRRYIPRAAFMFLAAHPLISILSYYFRIKFEPRLWLPMTPSERLGLNFPITDVIAICLLISPLLILQIGPLIRALLIMIMLIVAPLIAAFAYPISPVACYLKEAIFGVSGEPRLFWYPLIPWLAIFLSGSFVGRDVALAKLGILNSRILAQRLRKAGICLAVCCIALLAVYKLLKITFINEWDSSFFMAIYPKQATIFLPGYFAVLIWFFAKNLERIDIKGKINRFDWLLSIFSRTSLFTFIVQFAVVESAPAFLGYTGLLDMTGFLILFILGLAIMLALSYSYGRLRSILPKHDYKTIKNALIAGR
jgi:uncharacterized membrane protein